MADTVSDFVVQRLHAWGVRRIYGYPGDGINGLMGALDRAQDGEQAVEFVQARHEELAAFMACADAKFSGGVGVCLATSGPGAVHLLNGLYDAKADHQPVVAIVGQQKRSALGSDYQQEVDLVSLFKDVAHEYVQMASSAEQARHLVDRAMRIARDRRAVTCIILPNDVQELPAVPVPPRVHGSVMSGIGLNVEALVPQAAGLQRAAEILNAGERVAMLVGAGALHATDELIAVAERLGAGIAKALLGKAAVPDALPFVTGAIGVLGTRPSSWMMENCDTLLMVGTTFPYAEFLPEDGQARCVQIDVDPRSVGMRYAPDLSLIGDSRATLDALLPLLSPKPEANDWRRRIEAEVAKWWRVLEARAMVPANPLNPQRVFWELSPRLPDDTVLTCDSGSAANWYARDVKLRRGMKASLSGGLATMGPAVPYAIAAKFVHPDRPVVALVGDGAMQMNGINALITIARLWPSWKDRRLVVMVLNNRDLNLVTWEQRVLGGDPKFEASQDLPTFPYANFAEMLGLASRRIDKAEDIGPAWDAAFASDRPMLLEMVTDATMPPLPPDISPDQTKAYLSALWQGDPEALATLKTVARQYWASVTA